MIMPIGAVPDSRVVLERTRPSPTTPSRWEDQDLAGEAHPVELMPAFDDHARAGSDPAPAGNRLVRHEGLALDAAGYDRPPWQDAAAAHQRRPPFQRPVRAAETHSSSVPNHASMPRIAGR